jgi:uncharacterized protein DUF2628
VAVTVYSVYEPPAKAQDLAERAEGIAFVKEGFAWAAFLVPLLWLIYHRMWIELVVLFLIYVVMQLAIGTDSQAQALAVWASFAIAVLFAFVANDLRAASLERRGYRFAGAASGRDQTDAERIFFTAWLPQQERAKREPLSPPLPRRAGEVRARRERGEGEEVIGLFPQP